MQADPTGIAPERTLVFEVANRITDFSTQAKACGFDFLGEIEDEFDPDDDFYMVDEKGAAVGSKIKSTLYLVMPDMRALKELLSLWQQYKEGKRKLKK